MNDGVNDETTGGSGGGDDGQHTIITILFSINNNLFEATVPYDSGVNAGEFGGVPASAEAITGLKRQKHGNEDDDDAVPVQQAKRRRDESTNADEQLAAAAAAAACAICLEDFELGDGLAVMPCAHRFHDGCLTHWLALSRLCPCCRHALPSDPALSGLAAAISTATATVTAMMNAAEGGGAAAGADQEFQGTGGDGEAATRRRSRRARQANVRLFGPEWAADTSDDGLGLP